MLHRILRQCPDGSDLRRNGGRSRSVRFQVALLAREEVSTLTGLGILQRREDGPEVVPHIEGVLYPRLAVSHQDDIAINGRAYCGEGKPHESVPDQDDVCD